MNQAIISEELQAKDLACKRLLDAARDMIVRLESQFQAKMIDLGSLSEGLKSLRKAVEDCE